MSKLLCESMINDGFSVQMFVSSTVVFILLIPQILHNNNANGFRIERSAFFYRHNSSDKVHVESKERPAKNMTKHSFRPRFAVPREDEFKINPEQYICYEQYTQTCRNKTAQFRHNLVFELRKVVELNHDQIIESPEKEDNFNSYNVSIRPLDISKKPAICAFHNFKLRTLRRKDFSDSDGDLNLSKYIPKRKIFPPGPKYQSCVVVSSGGSLFRSNLGKFIDDHDLVLRFNHAPTDNFESDVGKKTTIRVVNSQVVSKPEFNFIENPLFQNITLLAWDPCRNMTNCDFDLFGNYKAFMERYETANFHLLDPKSLWKLWEILQNYHSQFKILRNPPSSGFIGITLLLPYCEYIDVVEYIPSTRMNGRCHYYEIDYNPRCTFGSWHPLSAEKLLVLDMNSADDYTTFQKGILRIRTNLNESVNC